MAVREQVVAAQSGRYRPDPRAAPYIVIAPMPMKVEGAER